jgi:hypothetical protein
MALQSLAGTTLRRARYFADTAKSCTPASRFEFEANISAAIVFGRSVFDHLGKQYARRDNFQSWYDGRYQTMQNDPMSGPFLERRNFIIHQHPTNLRQVTKIESVGHLFISGSAVDVKVIRGGPWHRRWYRTLVDKVTNKWRRWKQRRKAQDDTPPREVSTSKVDTQLFFDDLPITGGQNPRPATSLSTQFKQTPAFDVVAIWLEKLEIIIKDAENQWGV